MVRSLHLDTDDEPRRFGVGSRANSVRFVDDNSKSGPWLHASRSSVDLVPRTSSGLGNFGGHPLFERTVSHKSDGRQSSAGQSMSGRANSFLLDNSHPLPPSSMEPPGLAPGLFILGSVPAIIRCWLSTNFKHDSLLYAAVCTGSYKSYLDARLVNSLGLSNQIRQDLSGDRKVRVSMYLPEAILQTASSRSSSPAPQLPSLTVDFTVLNHAQEDIPSKAIQIVIGSDILRAHNADILFSSNGMTIFDDERCKLSIPFVRPENDESFKGLVTSAVSPASKYRHGLFLDTKTTFASLHNGNMDQSQHHDQNTPALITTVADQAHSTNPDVEESGLPQPLLPEDGPRRPESSQQYDRKASPARSTSAKLDTRETGDEGPQITPASRTSSSPAIWSNWRRDGSTSSQADWANASRSINNSHQRLNRDQGIKVLKPIRQTSRASSAVLPASPSASSQSRFFDDGKRRSGTPTALDLGEPHQPHGKRFSSGEAMKAVSKEQNAGLASAVPAPFSAGGSKPRSANPIGGASAFGWLNSGIQQK